MASYISRTWVTKRATLRPKSPPTILTVLGSQRSTDSSGNGRITVWSAAVDASDCDLPVVVGSGHVVPNPATYTVSSDNYRPLWMRRSIAQLVKVPARVRKAIGNILFRSRPEFEEERMYELDGKNYLSRAVCRSAGTSSIINPGTGRSGFRVQSRRERS